MQSPAREELEMLDQAHMELIKRYHNALNAIMEGEDMDLKREIAAKPEHE